MQLLFQNIALAGGLKPHALKTTTNNSGRHSCIARKVMNAITGKTLASNEIRKSNSWDQCIRGKLIGFCFVVGGYGKARHSGWFAAFFPIAAILLFAEARKGPMNGIPRSPVTSIDARIKHPKSP